MAFFADILYFFFLRNKMKNEQMRNIVHVDRWNISNEIRKIFHEEVKNLLFMFEIKLFWFWVSLLGISS